MRLSLPLFLGIILGFIIWWFSPSLYGNIEPWDGNILYYLISLLIAGILTGLLPAQYTFDGPVGVYVGQLLAVITRVITGPDNDPVFIPIGVIMLAIFSLPTLPGYILGNKLRNKIK